MLCLCSIVPILITEMVLRFLRDERRSQIEHGTNIHRQGRLAEGTMYDTIVIEDIFLLLRRRVKDQVHFVVDLLVHLIHFTSVEPVVVGYVARRPEHHIRQTNHCENP